MKGPLKYFYAHDNIDRYIEGLNLATEVKKESLRSYRTLRQMPINDQMGEVTLSPGLRSQAPANAGTESTCWPRQSLGAIGNTGSIKRRKTFASGTSCTYTASLKKVLRGNSILGILEYHDKTCAPHFVTC